MPKIMLKTPATKTESSNALSFSKPVEKTFSLCKTIYRSDE